MHSDLRSVARVTEFGGPETQALDDGTRAQAEQAIDAGRNFAALQDHGGWKLFEAVLHEQLLQLMAKYDSVKPAELATLQGRVQQLREVLRVIPDAVAQGDKARNFLKEYEAQDQE